MRVTILGCGSSTGVPMIGNVWGACDPANPRNRRLRAFQPSRAHLNTLIAAAGQDITARARHLIRNNGYAANAIESWAGNVVGAGIKPSSLIGDAELKARVQTLWLAWTDESDAEGGEVAHDLRDVEVDASGHSVARVIKPLPATTSAAASLISSPASRSRP